MGSASELETQLEIAKNLPQTKNLSYKEIDILLGEVSRMTMGMIKKLSIKS